MQEIDSVQTTIAIMALSGIQLSQDTIDLLHRIRDKRITYDEALEIIKKKVKEKNETLSSN